VNKRRRKKKFSEKEGRSRKGKKREKGKRKGRKLKGDEGGRGGLMQRANLREAQVEEGEIQEECRGRKKGRGVHLQEEGEKWGSNHGEVFPR